MIEIPPYPPTVADAKQQANDLAYGFEKHTGDYWDKLYAQDPEYAWKRMLGWQAGPEDAAQFGLWANPPSPWHGTPVQPPVPVPEPPPVPSVDIVAELAAIKAMLQALSEKPAPNYQGSGTIPYLGHVTFNLKPQES